MQMTKELTGNTLTIALEGRLDTMTAPELDAEIKNIPQNVTELILDFEKLEYVSSAGLRVLLTAQRLMKANGTMKVTHVNEIVYEVFEVTGLTQLLNIVK